MPFVEGLTFLTETPTRNSDVATVFQGLTTVEETRVTKGANVVLVVEHGTTGSLTRQHLRDPFGKPMHKASYGQPIT